MEHVDLLEDNMMIGYDDNDVYIMFIDDEDNEIIKISKN